MEVLPAEAHKLRQLMTAWSENDDYELEATFGEKGVVDATSFFEIARRLKSKGYEPLPQEDRLNIILPERIRITLVGSGIIQQYCRDDTLNNKPFVAIIKDRTFVESNLDLEEYNTRVKVRREIELAPDDARIRELMERWAVHRKAFRMIRRWSFAGKGVQFDLSIVRQTRRDARGEFKWVRTFREQAFIHDPAIYEVEVELHHIAPGESIENATKNLISGIGEILRGLQKNTVLIRNKTKNAVLNAYRQLTGTDQFRGVAPVTLEVQNMISTITPDTPNIRNGYNVTDKADGLRVLGFCDKRGELFLIDMGMNVYRTGLQRESCANALIDGEWITQDKYGKAISQLLCFDIYYFDEQPVDMLPFKALPAPGQPADAPIDTRSRIDELHKWITAWNDGDGPAIIAKGVNRANQLQVARKEFRFAPPGKGIFRSANKVLDKETHYNTDGLIFTPNDAPLPQKPGETFRAQFKWKPAEDNTIDFLINFEKDTESPNQDKITIGINPNSLETTRYKTMRLYVGTKNSPEESDPRTAILFGSEAFKDMPRGAYRPTLFVPEEFADTMAATCYSKVEVDLETGDEFVLTERSAEPIRDRSIVEMAYDPKREPGWRWVPIRVRHDKTERLQRGIIQRTLNNEFVANSVWNSIHNPITEYMIRTGSEEPNSDEIKELEKRYLELSEIEKVYYQRKAPAQDLLLVRGLRDFHNIYIKDDILYRVALHGGSKRVFDTSCGEGGDLQKWLRGNVSFVLGVDVSGNNIRNSKKGIYRRYLNAIAKSKLYNTQVPPMVFVIGDSSRSIVDGVAGATPEERDILRSVFGRVKPEGVVPPNVERTAALALRDGADVVACMFAIHYFFENRESFDGFINNINETLKVGGYFIGCCFDGESVFKLLRGLPTGQSKVGMVGDTPLWSITKSYDVDELSNDYDSLGHPIDVEFISIGTTQREYLVSFDFLVERMRSIGCELLSDTEAREVGLASSTNMFGTSYNMAVKSGKQYVMDDTLKQFSFLNRWFIFKRKGTIGVDDQKVTIRSAREEELENNVAGMMRTPNVILPPPSYGVPVAVPSAEGMASVIGQSPIIRRKKKKTVSGGDGSGTETDGESVRSEKSATADKSYTVGQIFQVSSDASQQDVLKIKEPAAGRWLSLSAPFPIPDPDDGKIMYPTVEHYLAAMKYKYATDKSDLAKTLFSTEGRIHQKYLAQRNAEGGSNLSSDRENTIMKSEVEEVRIESRPQSIIKHGAMYNDTKWMDSKDRSLTDALQYRWMHDKRLRKIIEAARDQNKYILNYNTASGSELGGKRRTADGRIEGSNKVGKTYMQLANMKI